MHFYKKYLSLQKKIKCNNYKSEREVSWERTIIYWVLMWSHPYSVWLSWIICWHIARTPLSKKSIWLCAKTFLLFPRQRFKIPWSCLWNMEQHRCLLLMNIMSALTVTFRCMLIFCARIVTKFSIFLPRKKTNWLRRCRMRVFR